MTLVGSVPFAVVADLRTIDTGRGAGVLHRDKRPEFLTRLADRTRVASIEASSAIEGVVVADRHSARPRYQQRRARQVTGVATRPSGARDQRRSEWSNVMADLTIGPLTKWAETLDERRAWVRGCIADASILSAFDTDWRVKLDVVAGVAEQLGPGETPAWQALGVVFGDALSTATGLPWGEVTDEYGTDPGIVANAANNAVVFPMTILSKRAEDGNPPDRDTILWLFQQVAAKAQELAAAP